MAWFSVQAGKYIDKFLHWLRDPAGLQSNVYEGIISPGVKQPDREANHSPPSSADVKNTWSYTSSPLINLHGLVIN
jgi:hypothetical protein